ncbi:golgin subfamily A member 6-like protein 24 [Engraulis encrasicolus]|uniref:golgin subfamily A member 6-like protein 24 n=1 Tax=Engraulis encrasicolus TaxID=184585 RepID=UPI002FD10086
MERELYKRNLEELQRVVVEMRREIVTVRTEAQDKLNLQRQITEQVMGQWQELERRRAATQKEQNLQLRQIIQSIEEERRTAEVEEKTREEAMRQKAQALKKQHEEEREAQESKIQTLQERLAALQEEKTEARRVNIIGEKRRKAFLKKARALRRKHEEERQAQQQKINHLQARLAALELQKREAPLDGQPNNMASPPDFESENTSRVREVRESENTSKVLLQTALIGKRAQEDHVIIDMEGVSDSQEEIPQGPKPSSMLSWISRMLGFGGH